MKPLWLLGLGIALLCIPCATFDGLDHCSFEQILGEWNILAIATNCEWIAEQFITAIMKVNITKLEDGSFNVTTNFCMEDVCLDIEMTYTKQENGMYICKSDVGDKIVERMKTDCKNYITMGTRDLNPFINDKIVALYARTMSVSQPVKQVFENEAVQMQVKRDHIFFLPKKQTTRQVPL